ncbi:MAG TPA: protein kinase, partial [Isosphaeraceae bacterium]|nr:protein kinase [Isosphaeraceae bacterium]
MSPCPPVERLGELVRGELVEAEGTAIENHLEDCAVCRQRLHALPDWAIPGAALALDARTGIGPQSRELIDRLARRPIAACHDAPDHDAPPIPAGGLPPQSPAAFPGFRLIREIGRGGMGTVYHAEQIGLDRHVALKVLSDGRVSSPNAFERFRREVRALARLRHPNVVRIYDVGEHNGLPFLVMEWIEGGDLAQRLREGPLPIREAAEFARVLARTVQAAHDSGIIHRDLKPGNILLAIEEPGAAGSPTPRIGDFGLARLIEDHDDALTQSGAFVGTPRYMAPEQTGLVEGAIQGPATDIYGLGAVLYEMLVARPPFGGGSRIETLHQVVAGDVVPPRFLRSGVSRDLETICLKCLATDPGRRYSTAGELAEELGRFLDGRPIRARRAPAWEHAVRWCRRRPAEARLALALMLVAVAAFAAVTALWRRADAEARRAIQAVAAESRLRAEAQAEVATHNLEKGIAQASSGDTDHGLLLMAEALRKTSTDNSGLLHLVHANLAAWSDAIIPLRTLLDHRGMVMRARYCDSGRAILTGSRDGTAQIWDATTGRPIRPPIQYDEQILDVAISPDGRRVATAGSDHRARLWDSATGRSIGQIMLHGQAVALAEFSPDGRLLATRDTTKECRLWDARTGSPVEPTGGGTIRDIAFTPDGRTVVTTADRVVLKVWSLPDGRPASPPLRCAAPLRWNLIVSPDSRRIAAGCDDDKVQVWDLTSGRAVGPPIPDGRPLAFSPDSRLLLAAGPRGRARLWDPETGRDLGPVFIRPPGICSGAFSPDGRLVLTGSEDHTARLWDAATGRPVGQPLRHRLRVRNVAFAPDGRSFLTASEDGTVKVWDLESVAPGLLGPVLEASVNPPTAPRWPDGFTFGPATVASDRSRFLLRTPSDGRIRLVATADGQPVGPPVIHAWPSIPWAAISPNGDRFATFCADRSTASTCQIFDTAAGRPTSPMLPHTNWPARLTFSPDGQRLATGDFDGAVHLWDVETGDEIGPPLDAGSIVQSLAFSPDGRLLAAGTAELAHQVVLWDLTTRRPRGEPIRFKETIEAL